ncbi:MAG: hypothetical protein SFZ03_06970 [Candidatus Melainabacteria bacterium]|nr:hypothetical protein [Candidatus Melainabacteria bacterium]
MRCNSRLDAVNAPQRHAKGQSLGEYSVLIALLCLVGIASLSQFGQQAYSMLASSVTFGSAPAAAPSTGSAPGGPAQLPSSVPSVGPNVPASVSATPAVAIAPGPVAAVPAPAPIRPIAASGRLLLQTTGGQTTITLPGGGTLHPPTVVETGAGYGTVDVTLAYSQLLSQLGQVYAAQGGSLSPLSQKLQVLASKGYAVATKEEALVSLHGVQTTDPNWSHTHDLAEGVMQFEATYADILMAPDPGYRSLSVGEQALIRMLVDRIVTNARELKQTLDKTQQQPASTNTPAPPSPPVYVYDILGTATQTYLDSAQIEQCSTGSC